MAYSRWSNSVWYIYGTDIGIMFHHIDGQSAFIDYEHFQDEQPPYECVLLQFKDLSKEDINGMNEAIKIIWEEENERN